MNTRMINGVEYSNANYENGQPVRILKVTHVSLAGRTRASLICDFDLELHYTMKKRLLVEGTVTTERGTYTLVGGPAPECVR
jgi:hypothetical protein